MWDFREIILVVSRLVLESLVRCRRAAIELYDCGVHFILKVLIAVSLKLCLARKVCVGVVLGALRVVMKQVVVCWPILINWACRFRRCRDLVAFLMHCRAIFIWFVRPLTVLVNARRLIPRMKSTMLLFLR